LEQYAIIPLGKKIIHSSGFPKGCRFVIRNASYRFVFWKQKLLEVKPGGKL